MRYRLANWGMWLAYAYFVVLVPFGFALKWLPDIAGTLFVLAFLLLLVVFLGVICATVYAFVMVRCGACDERFFDFLFLSFPVQGGCKGCGASINEAQTRRLREVWQR